MDEADGLIAMDTRATLETVRFVVLLTAPMIVLTLAVITVVPMRCDVARPAESTLTTLLFRLAHTADWVSSTEEPSLNIPVALNCSVCPSGILGVCGSIFKVTS